MPTVGEEMLDMPAAAQDSISAQRFLVRRFRGEIDMGMDLPQGE